MWCAGQSHLPTNQTAVWGLPRLATACSLLFSLLLYPTSSIHSLWCYSTPMTDRPHAPFVYIPSNFQRTSARQHPKTHSPTHKSHAATATTHCATTTQQRRLGRLWRPAPFWIWKSLWHINFVQRHHMINMIPCHMIHTCAHVEYGWVFICRRGVWQPHQETLQRYLGFLIRPITCSGPKLDVCHWWRGAGLGPGAIPADPEWGRVVQVRYVDPEWGYP